MAQSVAVTKCVFSDPRIPFGKNDLLEGSTVTEGGASDRPPGIGRILIAGGRGIGKNHTGQSDTVAEGAVADRHHGTRQYHAFQTLAVSEGIVSDSVNSLRQIDLFQHRALAKSGSVYCLYGRRKRHTAQAATPSEGVSADPGDAFRNVYFFKICTSFKCASPNFSEPFRKPYFAQSFCAKKDIAPDLCDRLPFVGVRNYDFVLLVERPRVIAKSVSGVVFLKDHMRRPVQEYRQEHCDGHNGRSRSVHFEDAPAVVVLARQHAVDLRVGHLLYLVEQRFLAREHDQACDEPDDRDERQQGDAVRQLKLPIEGKDAQDHKEENCVNRRRDDLLSGRVLVDDFHAGRLLLHVYFDVCFQCVFGVVVSEKLLTVIVQTDHYFVPLFLLFR